MEDILNIYTREVACEFDGECYLVRDNGSVLRKSRVGKPKRKLDDIWTFGTKDSKTGYMLLCGARVHRIVCTAFHGKPRFDTMVVDHKDCNHCNNRPENLSWVTRLENALDNQYTRKKIIYLCGSVEAFLKDPSMLRSVAQDQDVNWMRAVSKEEAANCLKNLDRWLQEDSKEASKNSIDEFIFGDMSSYKPAYSPSLHTSKPVYDDPYGLKPSLTPSAMQLNWKTPTAFPLCPETPVDNPLKTYLDNLTEGAVYCENDYWQSTVCKAELKADGSTLVVLAKSDGLKPYALTTITFEGGKYVHKSEGTFFHEDGGLKYYTLALGREWTGEDVFDDYC